MSHRTIGILVILAFLPLVRPPILEAQSHRVEEVGHVLQVLIPGSAFSATLLKGDTQGRWQFVKSFLTNFGATYAIKVAVGRERPDGSNHRAFPSGHTSAAFQGASFIHFRYGFGPAIAAYAGGVFVAYSRVHADKHYVSDVVAGAALGTLSSYLFTDRFQGVNVTPVVGGGIFGFQVRVAFNGG